MQKYAAVPETEFFLGYCFYWRTMTIGTSCSALPQCSKCNSFINTICAISFISVFISPFVQNGPNKWYLFSTTSKWCQTNCKIRNIYTVWTACHFAINHSQFKCVFVLFENIFTILLEPRCFCTRILWIKQRSLLGNSTFMTKLHRNRELFHIGIRSTLFDENESKQKWQI